MANETDQERAVTESPSAPESGAAPAPAPYVRQRPPHRTVEPIDDLAEDEEASIPVTHDSGYTVAPRASSFVATSTTVSILRFPRAGATSSSLASARRA